MKYSVETWERAIIECLYGRKGSDGWIIYITLPLLSLLASSKCFNKDKNTFNDFECRKWPESVAGHDNPNFWIMNKEI